MLKNFMDYIDKIKDEFHKFSQKEKKENNEIQ